MADKTTDVTSIVEEVKTGIAGLHDKFQKSLAEEREKNEELLKAKAEGKAVAEIKEHLEKLEKATNEAQKQFDDEIAKLKMSATSAAPDQEQELKADFFEVLRTGSTAGMAEPRKEALASMLHKQYNLCNEHPKSVDQIKSMLSGIDTTGGVLVVPPFL